MRILVVEDSPTQAEEVRLLLDREGFEVEVAPEAGRALDRAASRPFDLVVTDILLPGMSGYDLCRRLKGDPATRDVPVVLLTTLVDVMDIIRGLECGADNFITKPYDPAYLVARIRSLLASRELRAQGRLEVGVEVLFQGRKLAITSDKEQILDLLVATFEEVVLAFQRLQKSQAELADAHAKVEDYARRLEAKIRLSEEKYRGLMENANDAILLLGADGKVLELNRRAQSLLLAPGEDPVGRPYGEWVHADDLDRVRDAMKTLIGAGSAKTEDIRFRTQGGSFVHMDLSEAVVETATGSVLMIIARDMTARRQAEETLRFSDRMISVGQLAAGVAHEINNPLAALMADVGFAEEEMPRAVEVCRAGVERNGGVCPGVMPLLLGSLDSLREARETAERIRGIVADLRIFSRSEEVRSHPVDVVRVLESSLRMVANEIRHRARIQRDFSEVPRVEANEGRLGQVFLNLLLNAAQAIAEGDAEHNEIRVSVHPEPGDRLSVEIADTGCGIPKENLEKLFQPFFTTKPPGVGTGLGLSISRRIVTSLGGTIGAESTVGKGSLFRVVLPATREVPVEPPRSPRPPAAPRRGRILVVDDEPTIGSALKRVLGRDHEVVAFTTGAETLHCIRSGIAIDVILCDLMMPQMTGMDLYDRILEEWPALAPRIIFLTGGSFTAKGRAFLERVPNARIEKPFEPDRLRALLNDLLG